MRPKQSAGDARGELQAAALVHEARPVEFWGTPSVAFLPRHSRQASTPLHRRQVQHVNTRGRARGCHRRRPPSPRIFVFGVI